MKSTSRTYDKHRRICNGFLQMSATNKQRDPMLEATYGVRKATFGIADKAQLRELLDADAAKKKNVVFIDVRNADEIQEDPFEHDSFKCVRGKCLLSDDSDGEAETILRQADLLPDGETDRPPATLLVFCAKGGRAKKACERLKARGYANVYNAGGRDDLRDVVV